MSPTRNLRLAAGVAVISVCVAALVMPAIALVRPLRPAVALDSDAGRIAEIPRPLPPVPLSRLVSVQVPKHIYKAGTDNPAAPPASGPRNEPSIAVDPKDPSFVITASNDYNGSGVNAGAYYSTNGGVSFKNAGFMYRALGTDVAGDPALAYDSEGRAYFAYLDTSSDFTQGLGGMYIERSGDGGRTWPKTATKFAANSNTPKAGCIFQDKEYITTDPRNDNVYASWTNYHLGGAKCDGFDSSPVLFVRSTDGAKTFSKPVLASGSAKVKSQGSIPKVAPDGTIYVAYDSLQSGVTDICPTYSVSSSGATGGVSGTENVMVARSTNEGRSFSQTTAFKNACDVPYPTPTGGTYRQNSIPTFAIDPTNGTLVVAWPNQDISQQTIHVRVSKNGGKTWTDGQTLVAPGDAYQYPWLAFGADGRLYMTYLNQQPGGLFNAFLVVSKDDGKTWSQPDQLSNAQSFGDDAEFEGQFDGDYLGMAVGRDNVVHPVWTDIRNAFPTGTQNIWTKALRY